MLAIRNEAVFGWLFDEFERGWESPATRTVPYRADFIENDDAFVLTVALPGLADEDFDIRLEGRRLEIRAEREAEPPEGYEVRRRERGTLRFRQTYLLPRAVDADQTTARLQDGVLTLTLAKEAAAKPRQITVEAA